MNSETDRQLLTLIKLYDSTYPINLTDPTDPINHTNLQELENHEDPDNPDNCNKADNPEKLKSFTHIKSQTIEDNILSGCNWTERLVGYAFSL